MDHSFHTFRRVWAGSALALFAVTWRLWLAEPAFPQVPLIAAAGRLPVWIDQVAMGMAALSLVVVLLARSKSLFWQQALVVFVIDLALLVVIDQHRFQPWAYQFAIVAVVLIAARPPAAFALLRWLTIGIYVWSAWSKLDLSFTQSLGQQFLAVLLGWAGFEQWPAITRVVLATLIPVAELAVAITLCFPRLWPKAVWASVALHVLLLAILGPWGLHHKPGVLLWNVYFIAQNLLLFHRVQPQTAEEILHRDNEPVSALALCVVAGAMLWPLTEAWNYCDHWPAWSVYAPRVERTELFIHRGEQDRLPQAIQTYLEPAADNENWLRLRMDRWSLASTDTPLYPQNRFQMAVADGVVRQFGLTHFRIVRYAAADRWTGDRQSEAFGNRPQLEASLQEYLFGARTARPLGLQARP